MAKQMYTQRCSVFGLHLPQPEAARQLLEAVSQRVKLALTPLHRVMHTKIMQK